MFKGFPYRIPDTVVVAFFHSPTQSSQSSSLPTNKTSNHSSKLSLGHMSHSLHSLKGGNRGLYMAVLWELYRGMLGVKTMAHIAPTPKAQISVSCSMRFSMRFPSQIPNPKPCGLKLASAGVPTPALAETYKPQQVVTFTGPVAAERQRVWGF